MSSPAAAAAYSHYEYFLVTSPSQHVVHVEINRPSKLNAFSTPVWREMGRLFEQISRDPDWRAVVLSGTGDKAFTAGLDVTSANEEGLVGPEGGPEAGSTTSVERRAKVLRSHIAEFQNSVSALEKCEKPVICCVHGISIGLAIDIATSADIRLASHDTRFAVKEVDIGLAADVGTLARLPKVVGSDSWVKDVCLSARDFSAQEALSVGFVSQVHQGKEATVAAGLKMAALLASKSPVAVQGTKELLNHSRDHSVHESLRYTTIWNSVMVQGEDFMKGLTSALKRQKPTFAKL